MKNVVYKIEIQGYEKIYIGSAINFDKRKAHHLSQLRCNHHRNKHLQRIYNKYGENSFCFSILEQIQDTKLLLQVEQKWIDSFDFTKLINICPKAGNTFGRLHTQQTKNKISNNHHDVSGCNNPMFGKKKELSPCFGKKHTEQTKDKISKALKGKISWSKGVKRPEHSENMKGSNNPFYNKQHDEQTKNKISLKRKETLLEKGGQKLTLEIVREIRNRYKDEKITITKLAKEYNLSRTYCGQLLKGVYWNE